MILEMLESIVGFARLRCLLRFLQGVRRPAQFMVILPRAGTRCRLLLGWLMASPSGDVMA